MSAHPPFNFEMPPLYDGVSEQTNGAIRLAVLGTSLALEDRTVVKLPNGRAENVAEHSNLLGIVAPPFAEMYYPELDANRVARYCPSHDIIEAYVGDTPTHEFSTELQTSKEILEHRGLEQLKQDFAWIPPFVRTVEEYEAQVIPEARFVRVFDKLMPLLVHFVEGGVTYKAHFSASFAITNASKREQYLRANYPEYASLIDVRRELSQLAMREFL